MKHCSTTFVVLAFLFIPTLLTAQGEELVTDRPDQTESAMIVPTGKLQFEAGAMLGVDEIDSLRTSGWSAPTFLLRIGITETFELRFGGEFSGENVKVVGTDRTLSDVSGFGNLMLGAKAKIAEETGLLPEIAMLMHFVLPFGDMAPEQVAFSDIRLSASHTLTNRLGIGYNLGLETDDANPAVLRGLYTVAIGSALSEKLGSFLEFYGDAPWEDDAAHAFDAGFTWLLIDELQLDVSAGFGLSEAAQDYFLSAGFSVRVP